MTLQRTTSRRVRHVVVVSLTGLALAVLVPPAVAQDAPDDGGVVTVPAEPAPAPDAPPPPSNNGGGGGGSQFVER